MWLKVEAQRWMPLTGRLLHYLTYFPSGELHSFPATRPARGARFSATAFLCHPPYKLSTHLSLWPLIRFCVELAAIRQSLPRALVADMQSLPVASPGHILLKHKYGGGLSPLRMHEMSPWARQGIAYNPGRVQKHTRSRSFFWHFATAAMRSAKGITAVYSQRHFSPAKALCAKGRYVKPTYTV